MNEKWVFVVDDDPDDRSIVKEILEETKVKVQLKELADGQALLDYFASENPVRPELIMLDLNMPKVSGFEVLQHRKTNEHLRSIPVVVFSTAGRTSDKEKVINSGANVFFTKPSSYAKYLDVLSAVATLYL
jgi:CheY-like chemotaxis protein